MKKDNDKTSPALGGGRGAEADKRRPPGGMDLGGSHIPKCFFTAKGRKSFRGKLLSANTKLTFLL